MKFTFESELLLPPISKAISMLTDGAKVCIEDIRYDESKGIVNLQLIRKDITGYKISFLGGVKPVYGQTIVKSLLTIRQVEEMNIKVDENLVTKCNSCFTVLFGLKLEKNRLYLGSVEESRGKVMCQIFFKVKKISIDYSDEVGKLEVFENTATS